MAFDAFIQLEGIKGESTDDKHPDWVEISSYSFGASQDRSGSASSAGNLSSARVNVQDFIFNHNLDLASPKLFEYCCTGQVIPKVTVNLNRSSGDKAKYLEYKMSDVLVSSISRGGSSQSGGDVPAESVSLSFGKLEMTYTKIGMDGKPAGNTSAGWDLKINKKV